MARYDPFYRKEQAARNKTTISSSLQLSRPAFGVFHGEIGTAFHFWIPCDRKCHTFLVVRIRAMQNIQIYYVVIHFFQRTVG